MDATANTTRLGTEDVLTGFATNELRTGGEEPDLDRAGAVIGIVERAFALQPGALHASTAARMRSADLVAARTVAALLLRRDCRFPFTLLADTVGWKDQSSARYAFDRAEKQLTSEPDGRFAKVVSRISDFVQIQMDTPQLAPPALEEPNVHQPDIDDPEREVHVPTPRSIRGGFGSI